MRLFRLFINGGILFLLILLIGGGQKGVVYPTLQDMEAFRRSFSHGGNEIVASDFEESVIKAATLVKANLIEIQMPDAPYAIYTFEVTDDYRNPYDDGTIVLYEAKVLEGEPLYQLGHTYFLILARIEDLYYEGPIFYNFNGVRIEMDGDSLRYAMASFGEEDLTHRGIETYDQLLSELKAIGEANPGIKQGVFDFKGREIKDADYMSIILQSPYVVTMVLEEVLYTNPLMIEGLFRVESRHIGHVEDYILVSIPTYLPVRVGDTYFATLFKDGNYVLSSRKGLVSKSENTLYADLLFYVQQVMDQRDRLIQSLSEDEAMVEAVNQIPGPKTLLKKMAPYLEINEDVVGWIRIPDTTMDYPVLQGPDNAYYLNHNLYNEKDKSGAIIMDYRMDIENIQNHTLVYGHNMLNRTMFSELVQYKNKQFFDANPIVYLDTLYESIAYEVFSVHVIDSNYTRILRYPLSDQEGYQEYLEDIIDRSMFYNDTPVTTDDQILTLLTCSYEFDGARTVVHARRIN